MTVGVRSVHEGDLPQVTRTLARAFADDPVIRHIQGPDHDEHRASRGFEMLARVHLGHGLVMMTQGGEAGAIWSPPHHWKVPGRDIVRYVPLTIGVYRWRLPRALALLRRMERAHPSEPHYYLEVLGTDPAHQGRGLGASLIEPVLARADDEGVGAYLESSKDRNVPYYRRFGFEVTQELQHPNGPTMWLMWRDPR